jgi:hypothetical protein
VVAELWLREQVAAGRGDGVALGQLIGLERITATAQRAAWPGVWKKVQQKHPSSWV